MTTHDTRPWFVRGSRSSSHRPAVQMGRAFGGPAEDVRIEFRDPAVYGLTPEAIAAARPRVVAVFTARICACEPGLGDISAGHFIHIARETTDGTGDIELRSRFWIGRDVEKLGDGLLPPAWLIRVIGSLKLVKYLKVGIVIIITMFVWRVESHKSPTARVSLKCWLKYYANVMASCHRLSRLSLYVSRPGATCARVGNHATCL